jgi:ubiquitin C-terminal hydrolase
MCFFNTIVQCLAHIKRLTYFFLAYRELDELNYWNLDGTYGEVAVEYGRFIRAHCSSSNEECNMPLFETVGRWNPTYATKHQQDSHEFLIKMLDWLKEDLNLNERKPSYRNI